MLPSPVGVDGERDTPEEAIREVCKVVSGLTTASSVLGVADTDKLGADDVPAIVAPIIPDARLACDVVAGIPAANDGATDGAGGEVEVSVAVVSGGTTIVGTFGADTDGTVTVNKVSVDISTATEEMSAPFPSNPTGGPIIIELVKVAS